MARSKSKASARTEGSDPTLMCDSVHCEVSEVFEVSLKGVEYVVEVHPITETLFNKLMKPESVSSRSGFKDFRRYKAAYPHNTHIRYRRKKGNSSGVEFQGANPLALCRPIGGRLIDRKVHLYDEAGISRILNPDDRELADSAWKIYVGERGYYAVNEESLRQSLACPNAAAAEDAARLIRNQLAQDRGVRSRSSLNASIFSDLKFDIEVVVIASKKRIPANSVVIVRAQGSAGRPSYSQSIEARSASDLLPYLEAAVESLS